MKKVIIIGGGFAGITAIKRLSKFEELDLTLIDKRKCSNFLPSLPDIIGKRISPDHLIFSLEELRGGGRFSFLNEEVRAVSFEDKQVMTTGNTLSYDFLIIASGSETNFYGNDQIEKYAYKLDDASDATSILKSIEQNDFDTYIVAGGGYTGVEIATNLRRCLNRKDKKGRIIIVELSPQVLSSLPEWMKEYTAVNLKKMGIGVFTNTSIENIKGKKVILSGNQIFDNSMLIWAAGVKSPQFIHDLEVEKDRQGRVKVDEYLQLRNGCFVLGDNAKFPYKDSFLRMAVQFSIAQAEIASSNIIRIIKGKRLRKYKPLDLGYIIPMANNRSCGRILGVNMKGLVPTVLHYLMCTYRSFGLKNRAGIIKDLTKGGVR